MEETTFLTRIIHKHDKEEAWKVSPLIPLEGELIVYDVDPTHADPRFKIGDGKRTVDQLPFTTESMISELQKYIDDTLLNGEW